MPAPTARGLTEWAAVSGVRVPAMAPPVADYADQLAVIAGEQVPVLSFTFGIPDTSGYRGFTIGTATTVAEAVALERAGVDAVLAQGFEAGGHRGTFLVPMADGELAQSLVGTLALVPQVVDAVTVPVIAAGGIMDGRGIAAALVLGAHGVALGTAFLATDEAGIDADYRRALAEPTTVTPVLTGRHARAVRTPLVRHLEDSGVRPPDYPLGRLFLTGPPLLAGQGGPMARPMPAAELVRVLAREATVALDRVSAE